MHILTKIKKYKLIIGFIVFCCIVIHVFLDMTYLFRGHPYGIYNRISIIGLREEIPDSVDVIYIGGSAAYQYWEPYKAYNDYGFTSYLLSTDTLQADNIIGYLKYSQKYQNPELYIIGLRPFQYYTEEGSEIALRAATDSFSVGYDRFRLIYDYLKNHTMSADILSLYIDLIKYHTNYAALSDEMAWQLRHDETKCNYKGSRLSVNWEYLEEPKDFITDEKSELLPNEITVINELLDYCDENVLNVLFIVCPYNITKEDYAIYNTLKEIIQNRGFAYLNTNEYYEEMNIDFSREFINNDHVNAIGAEKYTEYLENYLVNHYELPDHRDDPLFAEWNQLTEWNVDQYDVIKNETIELINEKINQSSTISDSEANNEIK